MKRGLALFDFDGTITSKDSLLEFIRFIAGSVGFYFVMGIFSPWIIYYVFIKKEGEIAKRKVLSFLLKGKSKSEIIQQGISFVEERVPEILLPKAIEEINKHKRDGHDVVVISASLDVWLKPWTDSMKVELISTQMKFENGVFTGKFASPNCNGLEKVNRIKAYLNLEEYSPIFAYGNSKGDLPMLDLADYKYFKKFK